MTEKVLVTGGTGYIAGWCIVGLLERGFEVRATVRGTAGEARVRAAVATQVDPGQRLSFAHADLMADEGWAAAMQGCAYVLHIASPLGFDLPGDPEALTRPAREGTLRILRAASEAGVRRVVMTSGATVATPPLQGPDSLSDETVWFDPTEPDVDAYRQSKRLAELAAWEFVAHRPDAPALTTILPGAVFGPMLSADNYGSVQVIDRLLQGRMPATPRLGFEVVDVRDLADLHIRAMLDERAAGERFLGVGRFMWMSEIAQSLRQSLGSDAAKVPTRQLPDWLFKLLARFDPALRPMTPRLGRRHQHSADKARALLGWRTRAAEETLQDCARSLEMRRAR